MNKKSFIPLAASVLLLTGGLVPFFATAQDKEITIESTVKPQAVTASYGTLSVTGTGKATGKPDQATIQLGIESVGDTASEALEKNKKETLSLMASLNKQGVTDDKIQTHNLSINPRFVQEKNETKQKGFTAMNLLSVQVDDLKTLGALVDDSMSAGANQLQNIGFTVQDENKLQDAALKDAIENARKKAQAMADQMGVKLGTLLDFAETSSGSPRPLPVMRESMMMMAKSSDSASPVPSRDVETQASVSMTWKIMP